MEKANDHTCAIFQEGIFGYSTHICTPLSSTNNTLLEKSGNFSPFPIHVNHMARLYENHELIMLLNAIFKFFFLLNKTECVYMLCIKPLVKHILREAII